MPLTSGPGSLRPNLEELNKGKIGSTRKKAINTYAKNHGVGLKEARNKMSWIIAKSKLKTTSKKHKINSRSISYVL